MTDRNSFTSLGFQLGALGYLQFPYLTWEFVTLWTELVFQFRDLLFHYHVRVSLFPVAYPRSASATEETGKNIDLYIGDH